MRVAYSFCFKYINNYIFIIAIFNEGECEEYLSCDSIDRSEANDNQDFEYLTQEFLSCLKTSGLPNHSLKLKIGTTIMLIRNLDQS